MPDTRKDCCRLEENLGPRETPNSKAPDWTFRRCRVCQCRHFVLKADPGVIGLRGMAMGRRRPEPEPIVPEPLGYTDTLGGKA